MNTLAQCAPSRWADFLTIPDDAFPITSGENIDLFVGKNQNKVITINNGAVLKFRDVVVLGKLTIQSSNPENTALKPSLVARDVFIPSKLSIDNIDFQVRYTSVPKNTEEFHNKLQELFVDWMNIQRECVERIGLKSVLL